MNFGVLAMMMFVVVAAVMGIFVIAGGNARTPFVDSAGNTTGAQANASQNIINNGTATVIAPIGGGFVLIVAVLLIVFIVGGLIAVAPRWHGGNYQSRYR